MSTYSLDELRARGCPPELLMQYVTEPKDVIDRIITNSVTKEIARALYQVIEDNPTHWPTKIYLPKVLAYYSLYMSPNLKGFADGFGNILPVEIWLKPYLMVEHQEIDAPRHKSE